MGINTNTLNMGSSSPAQGLNAARPETASASGSGSTHASSFAAGGSGQSTGTPGSTSGNTSGSTSSSAPGGTSSGRKATAHAAQTPNAQSARNRSASRAKAHPTGSHTQSAGSASGQAGASTGTQDADDSANNFGSVLSTALGQGTAATNNNDSTAKVTSDATAAATPGQQAPGASADAVAWFTQVLVPSATATQPATAAPASGTSAPASSTAVPASSTAAGAAANAIPAPIDAGPQALALAAQAPTAQASTGQAPTGQDSTAQAGGSQTAATANALSGPGNISTLANVQQLIAGLTGANSTTNPGAAPATHAATADASTDAAQAAAALQAAALTRADPGLGSAILTIHAPVGSAAFAAELSARIAGMAPGLTPSGITQAQLQLNPVDLGPVQVHITMQAGQASVWFGATHPDTRAALEQSLPQLRQLFAGAGMPLTDSGVFREPPRQQQAPSPPLSGITRSTAGDITAAPTVTQVSNIRLALLDTYA